MDLRTCVFAVRQCKCWRRADFFFAMHLLEVLAGTTVKTTGASPARQHHSNNKCSAVSVRPVIIGNLHLPLRSRKPATSPSGPSLRALQFGSVCSERPLTTGGASGSFRKSVRTSCRFWFEKKLQVLMEPASRTVAGQIWFHHPPESGTKSGRKLHEGS